MASNTVEPEKAVDSPHPVTRPFHAIEVTDIDRIWSIIKAATTKFHVCVIDQRRLGPDIPTDFMNRESP